MATLHWRFFRDLPRIECLDPNASSSRTPDGPVPMLFAVADDGPRLLGYNTNSPVLVMK